jgi:predicted phage terminase large subunit-like protein
MVMLQTTKLDGLKCAQREEREGGSAGKAVIAARAKALVGYDYQEVPISGSKIVRSKPYRSQCAAGNVFLVRGEWNEPYISELCTFPTGRHDDQVDGSSAAFNAVLLEPALDGSLVW